MHIRRTIVYGLVAVLMLLGIPQDRLLMTPLESLASTHLYSLVGWETNHFLQKWWQRTWNVLPIVGSSQSDAEAIQQFFSLTKEVQDAQSEIIRLTSMADSGEDISGDVRNWLTELKRRRDGLRGQVEEALEGAIGRVLEEEGVTLSLGPIRWPPVDFAFVDTPTLLVTSPRDRIYRKEDVLLKEKIPLVERLALEEEVFQELDLSSLVVNIGGVATYPAIISPQLDLHGALVTASHEWVHHFFYFRPLGQRFRTNAKLMTLNESAATLLGKEIGDRAYHLLTDKEVVRDRPSPIEKVLSEESDRFDFQREMRKTRLRVEVLLLTRKVEEAELYMEERRRIFVANGFDIRKLNQAYFAFHGTYAGSPASVSPIDEQLRELRSLTPSLKEFARGVAGVRTYEDFLRLLEKAQSNHSKGAGSS
jgi:hypothetical protein